MNLLLLDTETTGIDAKKFRVVEVAAAIYNVETRCILWHHGSLCSVPDGHEWDPVARRVNGISDESLAALVASQLGDGWERILQAARAADVTAVVAHNTEFDKSHAAESCPKLVEEFGWICSKDDFKYPQEGTGRRLDYLCADHRIVSIGPFRHRAFWDVLLIAAMFNLIPDLEDQVRRALVPKAEFRGLHAYEQNEEAKKHGFRWVNESGKKGWFAKLPVSTPTDPTPERPFSIVRTGG